MSLTSRFTQGGEHRGAGCPLPVAAGTIIYNGNLTATNAQGFAVPATDTAGLTVAGVAVPSTSFGNSGLGAPSTQLPLDADNSTGAAGALSVPVRQGIFRFRNSTSAPLASGDLGKMAVVQDPETVAKTSTNHIPAGVVLILEAGFVWIWFPCYPGLAPGAMPAAAWRSFGVGTFGS